MIIGGLYILCEAVALSPLPLLAWQLGRRSSHPGFCGDYASGGPITVKFTRVKYSEWMLKSTPVFDPQDPYHNLKVLETLPMR